MSDYYIRTPEQDESRGPFDVSKLVTLAEAGQINPNTLYYDEEKEEWLPITLNKPLLAQVFPENEKLSLKIEKKAPMATNQADSAGLNVESMLAAAEGDTAEKRKLTQQKKSLERTANISTVGLGLMLVFSALFLLLPLQPNIQTAVSENALTSLFNFPVVWIGLFDLIVGILLFLSVTEVYPLLRGRGMLTLGFGLYVGWALGDPLLMGLTTAAGFGIFLATLAQSMSTLILAFILGIGGNGYLAYLALNGRFDGFFNSISLNLIAS